jgi:ectoine hydroxylase-related dioxygenase (phytanoyl-CoA dioxygenase family)
MIAEMDAERETAVVDDAARERYERDGYLIVESLGCQEELLDGIVADMEGRYGEPHEEGGVLFYPRRIQDAWRISDNVRALARNARILALLEVLYGRKPLPFQTLNFWVGTEQAPHSDTVHFNSMPPGYMCGVWVALEDMDMENGPLVYYPGSQRLPEITMQDVGVEADPTHYPEYERFVSELIERNGLEPSYATIRKGQALIWSANLLHGGSAQKDKSRTRHSQVTHFFFEGCKYYSPLSSGDGHVHWKEPEWIT